MDYDRVKPEELRFVPEGETKEVSWLDPCRQVEPEQEQTERRLNAWQNTARRQQGISRRELARQPLRSFFLLSSSAIFVSWGSAEA